MSDEGTQTAPEAGETGQNENVTPFPAPVPDATPAEPVYVDMPAHLQLLVRNAELEVEAATKALDATKARADLVVSEIADVLGYRASQVQFERVPGENGATAIKLRIK